MGNWEGKVMSDFASLHNFDMWLQSGNPLDIDDPCYDCTGTEMCKECDLCPKHCDCSRADDIADMRYAEMKDNDYYYVPWSV
jgi:hypothetical protein